MRLGTAGTVVAALGIAAGGGCASTPDAASRVIYQPAPSDPEEMHRGPQLRGLTFDPRGADFGTWVDDFEQKVHHNWILPAYRGYGGRIDFALVVERNGTVTTLEMLESTASEALEEAAREAFARSRFEPLPEAYDRLRVSLRVTCVYGPRPGE